MNIKCGNCHGYHESVAEVRSCCASIQDNLPGEDYASRPPISGHRPNRFAGSCKLCGSWVEAEAGHIEKVNGKWTVFHNSGDCAPGLNPPSAVDHDDDGSGPVDSQGFPDVPEGHYAVKSLTGNNDLDFFRVDRPEQGQWAGYTFVKRVIGGKPDSRVRGARNINKILQAILDAGADAAGHLYGQKLGQCYDCNRSLTKYASRQLSLGRTCADRHGLGEKWDEIQAGAPEDDS